MTVRRRQGFSSSEFTFRRTGEPASPSSLNLLPRVDAEFFACARCACLCGELVGAGARPRVCVSLRNWWRAGSATGCASGIFGVRTRCPRRGDGAGISRRTPPGDRSPARTIFGFPYAAGCPAPVQQGTAPFQGRKRQKRQKEGEEESAAGAWKCGGTLSAFRVCVPGGPHPEIATDALTHLPQSHFLTHSAMGNRFHSK